MKRLTLITLLFFSIAAAAQEARSVSVYFPFDQYKLTPEASATLDSFYVLQQKEGFAFTISGYCDSVGSHAYNDRLSKRRSFAVHEYLLQKGVAKNAVTLVQGFGKRRPVNGNQTEAERLQNRRVDLLWSFTPTADTVRSVPPAAKQEEEPPIEVQDPRDTVPRLSRAALDSVPVGATLVLRNINFYGGRHRFLPNAYESLDELVAIMKERPGLEIELQGHICCRYGYVEDGIDLDTGEYQLSRNRSLAVYYYLVDHGIDKRRMRYRGFAGRYPLIWPELSESDRTVNRRVEVKILKK